MGQDNHIQNGGLGRYSVGYTFGKHILHKTKFLIVYPTILAPHIEILNTVIPKVIYIHFT